MIYRESIGEGDMVILVGNSLVQRERRTDKEGRAASPREL